MVKNPPANAGDVNDVDSVPGLGRSPGGGDGSPLQFSCLENPTDRGAWRASVLGSQRVSHDCSALALHRGTLALAPTFLSVTHTDTTGGAQTGA